MHVALEASEEKIIGKLPNVPKKEVQKLIKQWKSDAKQSIAI